MGAPQKEKKIRGPWARAQRAHWLRRPWSGGRCVTTSRRTTAVCTRWSTPCTARRTCPAVCWCSASPTTATAGEVAAGSRTPASPPPPSPPPSSTPSTPHADRSTTADRSLSVAVCSQTGASDVIISAFLARRTFAEYIHSFNGPFSETTRVSRYQKGKTNLDFTGARDSEWQWNELDRMQVCISLQTDNHASTPPLKFFYRPDALPAAQPTASKH